MDCKIMEDLLPLYADDCCTEQTRWAVEAHLAACPACREALEAMGRPLPTREVKCPKNRRVKEWKASILQSLLLFAAFGVITYGVAQEARMGSMDMLNGYWALALVVPATGFLLSLANWYFVRLYQSRAAFSWVCCGLTIGASMLCALWAVYHYEWGFDLSLGWFWLRMLFYTGHIFVSLFFCVLSKLLSAYYAKLLGKE